MEANTVVLALDKYNELREFKEKILAGNVYVIGKQRNYGVVGDYGGFGGYNNSDSTYYYTTEEAIAELVNLNITLASENDELRTRLHNINVSQMGINIHDVKKMSIWQFIKWRKR